MTRIIIDRTDNLARGPAGEANLLDRPFTRIGERAGTNIGTARQPQQQSHSSSAATDGDFTLGFMISAGISIALFWLPVAAAVIWLLP